MSDAPEPAAPTDRDALRRMLETGGCCHSSVWLQNRKTAEWYCWDFCNDSPGHDEPHTVTGRDGAVWAAWGSGQPPSSLMVDLAGADWRPSPWTPDEIAILRSVESEIPA